MDTSQLREFIVLSESRSISSAAKRLGMVPSTLSRHLQALEDELGINLIERTSSEFGLTMDGFAFLEKAHEMMALYSNAMAPVRVADSTGSHAVKVGGHLRNGSIATLLRAVPAYLARRGSPIRISPYEEHTFGSVQDNASNNPLEALRDGEMDLAIVVAGEGDDFSHLECEHVMRMPLSVVFASFWRTTYTKEKADLRDFKRFTLLLAPFQNSLMRRRIQICEQVGFTPQVRYVAPFSFGDVYTVRTFGDFMLTDQVTAASIPKHQFSGLVTRELANPEAYLDILAIWLPEKRNADVDTVVEALKDIPNMLDGKLSHWSRLVC